MKAYRVDFKYMAENTASMFVIAETEDIASAGALEMLAKTPNQYSSPVVTQVEEYNPETTEDENNPTIN